MKKVIQIALTICLIVSGAPIASQAQSLQSKQTEVENAVKRMGIKTYQITLNEVKNNQVVATTTTSSKAFATSRLKQVFKYENGSGDDSAKRMNLYIQKDGGKWSIFIRSGANLTTAQIKYLNDLLNK